MLYLRETSDSKNDKTNKQIQELAVHTHTHWISSQEKQWENANMQYKTYTKITSDTRN